ncbi:MAG: hypothetical protein HEP71_34970, partial [Roseivirga sp.]|nr:hypothetical protein [Roseivirga sp.]
MLKKLIVVQLCLILLCTVSVTAQVPYKIISVETYAGSSSGSANGSRLDARFNEPIDMVFDASGNLYIAEEGGSVIRIMDVNGNVSAFVGSSGNTGLVDGTGSAARFFDIRGITLDNDGNLIVADKENHAIRKVTPAGVVTTIAGGTAGFMDGIASVAMFNKPTSVLVDDDGNIFVGDAANNRIRKIDIAGNVTTLIGTGTAGYQDGDVKTATIDNPTGMVIIDSERMIISTRLAIRQFDLKEAELSTIVGGNNATPFADGDKNSAGFSALQAVYSDHQNSIFIVDRHALRHVASDGTVTTLAGSSAQGTDNGNPLDARFFFPRGLTQTPEGDFLIADKASHKIRRIFTEPGPTATITSTESEPSSASSFEVTFTLSESSNDFSEEDITVGNGDISNFTGSSITYTARITPTIAGTVTLDIPTGVFTNASGTGNQSASQFSIASLINIPTVIAVETYAGSSSGSTNGNRLDAKFNEPIDMVFDASGNLYIAEEGGSSIRIMDVDGNISDFVGSSGNTGLIDGTGSAARFNQIRAITFDKDGNLIVADKDNHAVRKVTLSGEVTTIAGGTPGFLDGDKSVALFNKPTAVIVDDFGNIFVGDGLNNKIRKIDPEGNVTTLIGTGAYSDVDGDLSTAAIRSVGSLTFDLNDDLIITSALGIRKYDFESGMLSTIVGGDTSTPFADGDKNMAGFNAIQAVYIDAPNTMYIVDRHALRHVAEDGTVTTLAGSGTQGISNGAPLDARFFFPRGIVKNSGGDFLIADKASHKIRRIFTNLKPSVSVSTNETSLTNAASFAITVTFSEDVTDFTADDITVGNGTIDNFAGSGAS